jgi:multicomponent Na+:H+ antiporter subunit D
VTALLGAVMAFRQDHLKRLIAFATVSSIGTALIGLSLLSADGAAAAGVYVVGDGFAKATLFAGVGMLQHRFGSVSERRLRGEGRRLPAVGAMFALAAVAVAALPPFGPFLGKAMLEDALVAHGHGWAIAVVVLATALTGGALLRAAGRVFGGLGPEEREKISPADRETDVEAPEIAAGLPPLMLAVTGFLLACTLASGCWFGFADAATAAASHFTDAAGYAAAVFGGHPASPPTAASDAPRWFDWVLAAVTVAGALLIAAVALFYPRLRRGRRRPALLPLADRPLRVVEGLHSGHVGDYVAWLTAGLAAFGAAFALVLG